MTREETKKAIAVMQAWCEGKNIKFRPRGLNCWLPLAPDEPPSWNHKDYEYHTASEPKYRPWKLEEVPVGRIVRSKDGQDIAVITRAEVRGNCRTVNIHIIQNLIFNEAQALENWTMDDGSPCGSLIDAES